MQTYPILIESPIMRHFLSVDLCELCAQCMGPGRHILSAAVTFEGMVSKSLKEYQL